MKRLVLCLLPLLATGCANMSSQEFNYKMSESLRIMNESQFGQRRAAPPTPTPVYVVNPAPAYVAPRPIPPLSQTVPAGNLQPNIQMRSLLTDQYFLNGQQMCRYADGAVIPSGVNVCPLSR